MIDPKAWKCWVLYQISARCGAVVVKNAPSQGRWLAWRHRMLHPGSWEGSRPQSPGGNPDLHGVATPA